MNIVNAAIPYLVQFAIPAVFLGLCRCLLGKKLTMVPSTPGLSEAMPIAGGLPHAFPSWWLCFASGDCHYLYRVWKHPSLSFNVTGQFPGTSHHFFPPHDTEMATPQSCASSSSASTSWLQIGKWGEGAARCLFRPMLKAVQEGRRRQKINLHLLATFQKIDCAILSSCSAGSSASPSSYVCGRAEEDRQLSSEHLH